MINIVITELQKLKRYSILWIGIVAVAISPIMSVFTQKLYVKQDSSYGFKNLINDTIWNNMGMIFPITIALIAGYMINREYMDHTLKNILPIPISFCKMLIGKLIAMAIVTAILGIYSFFITLICSALFFPSGITFSTSIKGLLQITCMSLCIYIAEMPIIAFCARKPDMFMGGVIVSFVYGYMAIFISGANLQDIYPLSAGLGIIGYGGDTGSSVITYHPMVGYAVLLAMIAISAVILIFINLYWKNDFFSKSKKKVLYNYVNR